MSFTVWKILENLLKRDPRSYPLIAPIVIPYSKEYPAPFRFG